MKEKKQKYFEREISSLSIQQNKDHAGCTERDSSESYEFDESMVQSQ